MSGSIRSANVLGFVGSVAIAMLLAGCSSGSSSASKTPSPTPPTALQTALAVTTSDATIAAGYATPTVHVTTVADGKRILTDTVGRTLYVFSDDVPATGISQCTDSCARTWPPVEFTVGQNFQIAGLGLFGSFARSDGVLQLMYRGRPLYRYTGDTAPGETNGDGIDGKWSIAVP